MTESSKWTCLSGDVCELTYDLGVVESLEQLRVGESHYPDQSNTWWHGPTDEYVGLDVGNEEQGLAGS